MSESTSLQDIVTEATVNKIKNNTKLSAAIKKSENSDTSQELLAQVDDLASDALIARLLQQQFEEERNMRPKRILQIPVSFTTCYRTQKNVGFKSISEEEEKIDDFRDHRNWERFDTVEKEIDKHDAILYSCNKTGFDTNSSKMRDSLRLYRKRGDSTVEYNIDEFSRMQLHNMMKNQMLERLNHVINIGSKADIICASGNPAYSKATVPETCVLKVFNKIKNGFKFAEMEMHNLLRIRKTGIPCPEVVLVQKNILIMSFIGENFCSAPRLKDATMTSDEYVLAYNQVVEAMKTLYNKARLVCTDLSEYNTLWYNKQCYFIDVGHLAETIHENTYVLLSENCKNIIKFFGCKKLHNIMTPEELFIEIAGFDFNNKIDLEAAVKRSLKIKPRLDIITGISAQPKRAVQIPVSLVVEENIADFCDHKNWNQSDTVKEEIEKHDTVLHIGNGTRSNAKSRNKITKGFKLYWKLDHITVKYNLDGYSKVLINNLIESKMLKRVNYVISAERGSVLLHAHGNPAYPHEKVPKECVLRVFRLTGNVWNANQRRPVNHLAEREMKEFLGDNVRRNYLCPGIPRAEVITVKEHIHIFSFVGQDFLSYISCWNTYNFQEFKRSLDLTVKLQKVVA